MCQFRFSALSIVDIKCDLDRHFREYFQHYVRHGKHQSQVQYVRCQMLVVYQIIFDIILLEMILLVSGLPINSFPQTLATIVLF